MGTDIHTIAQIEGNGRWVTVADDIGGELRNYHSFAVLADVRNGVGFAGCETSEPWRPISQPRGLPEDFPKDQDYLLGDHSHSWLMLSEIEQYTTAIENEDHRLVGILTKDHYMETLAQGKDPESWCGGIGGPNVKIGYMFDDEVDLLSCTHVMCSWYVRSKDVLTYLFDCVDHLKSIALANGAEDVRLVFGFDS